MPPNKVRLPTCVGDITHRRDIGALCGCGSAFSSTKMPHRLFECIDTVNRGFAGGELGLLGEGVGVEFPGGVSSSAGSAVAGALDVSMVSKSKGSSGLNSRAATAAASPGSRGGTAMTASARPCTFGWNRLTTRWPSTFGDGAAHRRRGGRWPWCGGDLGSGTSVEVLPTALSETLSRETRVSALHPRGAVQPTAGLLVHCEPSGGVNSGGDHHSGHHSHLLRRRELDAHDLLSHRRSTVS